MWTVERGLDVCAVRTLCLLVVLTQGIASGAERFQRGDANADGSLNISDSQYTLGFLFLDEPLALPCEDAADSNDDGVIDLSDSLYTLSHLFLGKSPPPPPAGTHAWDCGKDPTPDLLSCDDFPACSFPHR